MPVEFTTLIKKFNQQGEKTGWTYIDIPEALATQLLPGSKKSFRVKGWLDQYAYEGLSLVPMGGGDFILALNATIRKSIGKTKGAMVKVRMEIDTKPVIISPDLMECLQDEPKALAYFNALPPSHRKYYSNWIESAKTEATKAKRIVQALTACSQQMSYGEMIRSLKNKE